jgi:hypothetical protein
LYHLYHYLQLVNPPDSRVVREEESRIVSPEIIQHAKIRERNTYDKISGISFLFDSYLPKCWYFEVVECFRRLCLTAIPIVMLRSTSLQVVLIMLLSLAFCAVYMELRPFAKKSDNQMAILSQWAVTLTVLCSLCLRVDMSEEVSSFGPDAIGVIMTVLNVFIIILTLCVSILPESDDVPTREGEDHACVDKKTPPRHSANQRSGAAASMSLSATISSSTGSPGAVQHAQRPSTSASGSGLSRPSAASTSASRASSASRTREHDSDDEVDSDDEETVQSSRPQARHQLSTQRNPISVEMVQTEKFKF